MKVPSIFSNASVGNVIALLSAAASIYSIYVSRNTSIDVQERQIRFDLAKTFTDASGQLTSAGGAFIGAINVNANLQPVRAKLDDVLAQQSIAAINIKSKLQAEDVIYVDAYVKSLEDLHATTANVSSPTGMRVWAESFGKVLDTRSQLTDIIEKTS